jgi:hypothetical protein
MRKCIDCGNDGNKELGLIIYTPMNIESWEQHIVVKDVDDTLQMIYADVAWSRSSIYMNEYGYIFGDGSGGAAYHGFDKSFIDADGKWHFIYSDSSTAQMMIQKLIGKVASVDIFIQILLMTIQFMQIHIL